MKSKLLNKNTPMNNKVKRKLFTECLDAWQDYLSEPQNFDTAMLYFSNNREYRKLGLEFYQGWFKSNGYNVTLEYDRFNDSYNVIFN